MSASSNQKAVAVLAEFANPAVLLHAAEKVRDAGYDKYDCHSPFPVHGLDAAMGLKKSILGWVAAAGGIAGGSIAFALQWWVHNHGYAMNLSGKPYFAFQAYVPVTFELTILGACFGTVIGMFIMNFLPWYTHPVFESDNFRKATDNGFFISIEAEDERFDAKKCYAFLQSIGGKNVEVLIPNE
ncbi:MAG TPA: DUF3341 domain-containing protein [Lentisphaeria bacterium]|jgi:hypothetical protein|nr:DUF3341 domain-containing protein [Lentisphaeria bacterium]